MYLKVIIVVGFFVAITGCSKQTSQLSPTPDYQTEKSIDGNICAANDTIFTYSTNLKGMSFDEKLALAEYRCSEKKYHEADSILKAVLSSINSADETEVEWIPTDQYIETIIKIYTLMMPPEYITDDIAMIQFKRQMLASLDTLNYSSEDSALINKLISRKDISFDIPMVWNDRVKKALNYYLRGKPETIVHWLQRANFYLPKIKKMFADSGLPQDLAYLPLIESGFNTQAYSRAHAAGIWQFIPSTGKNYGLRQSYWFDERRDPMKATVSAIRYLRKLHDDFGNWHLALAAYNCGEGGVSRAITRSGTNDYWQLPLPSETKNYVPLYLAALTIAKNPDLFNFSYSQSDSFAFDTVLINDCIDMRDLAQGVGIDYETFRKINPQITHWCTPPDVSNVRLYLPQGTTQLFNDYYATIPDDKKVKWYAYKVKRGDNIQIVSRRFKVSSEAVREINRLRKDSRIIAGHILYIPIPANTPNNEIPQIIETTASIKNEERTVKKTATDSHGSKVKYKVKKGDTISEIAEMFDVSIEEIGDWNSLSHSQIQYGQILTIYTERNEKTTQSTPSNSNKYQVQIGDTPYSIARRFGISVNDLARINDLDMKNPLIRIDEILIINPTGSSVNSTSKSIKSEKQNENYTKYSVAPGDNLYRIAQNFSIPLDELIAANDLSENSAIHAGDILRIPRTEALNVKKVHNSTDDIVYYKIQQGDNLWHIAETFGIPVQNLFKANHLNPDSVLMPGDTIKVVKTGGL
jgi:membrane-bound lytic murein transglycosylase D